MNPTGQEVHADVHLTTLAVAYWQDKSKFVADKVFPVVRVAKQSDKYYVWNRADWNRALMRKRAPATESAGASYRMSDDQYYAHVWALHRDISDQDKANADSTFNLESDASEFLMRNALLTKEVEFADTYLKTGVWATDITGVDAGAGANQTLRWNDGASDPVTDIDVAMAKMLQTTGFEPNTLTLGYRVYQALRKHPDILDRVKYVQQIGPNGTVRITEAALAGLFDVERVFVLRAIENTAEINIDPEAAGNENNVFIGGDDALLSYSPPSPSRELPSAGYTFAWTGYLGDAPDGVKIMKFYIQARKATRVEGEATFAHKVVAPDLGYFFNDIVAAAA